MEHLNYCRQYIKSVALKSGSESDEYLPLAIAAHKFILPNGGVLFADDEYRALDSSVSLQLPFPLIALEYEGDLQWGDGEDSGVRKNILFIADEGDYLRATPLIWVGNCWVGNSGGDLFLKRGGFGVERAETGRGYELEFLTSSGQNGDGESAGKNAGFTAERASRGRWNFVYVMFQFLNALACSNVRVARSEPRKVGKKVKASLPFDAYHVLTIDAPGKAAGIGAATGCHRSPREHLRRGHIRRLEDGRRIWVNATVVAAGRGAGVVSKDYALRSAAIH